MTGQPQASLYPDTMSAASSKVPDASFGRQVEWCDLL
jgi:hypothetical protein